MEERRRDLGFRAMLGAMGVAEELVGLGGVVIPARGRYALSSADEAVARAHALGGVLSYDSAALWHGWALKTLPPVPHACRDCASSRT